MSGQAREGGNAPLTGFSSGVSDGGRGEGLAVKLSGGSKCTEQVTG